MLLSEGASVAPLMQKAFLGFGIFWLVVVVGLFFSIGFLLKRYPGGGP